MSGYAPEGTVSDDGMSSPLLTKPFTAAQLIDRIRALLADGRPVVTGLARNSWG